MEARARSATKRASFDPEKPTEVEAGNLLTSIYKSALNGVPKVSRSVDELVHDYMSRNESPKAAAKELAKWQVMKCGTSGFITGLGGLITLPVAIPANISSVLYVQMRMIAAIAQMGGYDVRSDQVQTMVFMCLTGASIADAAKHAGIKIGKKGLEGAIKKISGEALVKINQKIGFRLITKFGEKGVINLGKMIPVAGGVIGGGVDVASTVAIARNAIKMFIENEKHADRAFKVDENHGIFPEDEDSDFTIPADTDMEAYVVIDDEEENGLA